MIKKVFTSKKKYQSRYFSFLYKKRPYDSNDTPRMTIIVSKKISKKAVIRNRIKRIFRSAMSSFLVQLPKSIDAIILPKPHTERLSSTQCQEDLLKAVKWVQIQCK